MGYDIDFEKLNEFNFSRKKSRNLGNKAKVWIVKTGDTCTLLNF